MDLSYKFGMELDEKDRLSHRGNIGIAACSIRLRAARMSLNLSQKEVIEQIGVNKQTYNAMELGRSFPSREVMQWLYRSHRIDFNFLMNGDFAQLPTDVSERLFAELPAANSEWDRKRS